VQEEATREFCNLLVIERNPPIQQVINASVIPRFVEFLTKWQCTTRQFGVRSGPGEARTILLLHIISVRPSKQQPLMVRTFLEVYMELGSYFLFL